MTQLKSLDFVFGFTKILLEKAIEIYLNTLFQKADRVEFYQK